MEPVRRTTTRGIDKVKTRHSFFLCLLLASLGTSSASGAASKCTLEDDTWKKAISLYRQGLYEKAIAMTESTPCPPKDKQLVISSYMGLYLLTPTPEIAARARAAINELAPKSYGGPDVGFLLVALNDLRGARDFYESMLASLEKSPPHDMPEKDRQEVERRFRQAINVIDSRAWSPDDKLDLIRKLESILSGKNT